VAGACPPQRSHDCRQYGPAVMKAASHLPNMACSHMTHLAVVLCVKQKYTDQYEKLSPNFRAVGMWAATVWAHSSRNA